MAEQICKVTALVSGRNTPSTRFRVLQHVDRLRDLGVAVNAQVPLINKYQNVPLLPATTPKWVRKVFAVPWTAAKLATRLPGILNSRSGDVTWLEREILPGYFTLEPLLKTPLVFDVDDAIWLAAPFGRAATRKIAERADQLIVGNPYLADWFHQYNRDLVIVPTAVDVDIYKAAYRDDNDGYFNVGWIGTSSNNHHLLALEPILRRFFDEHSKTRLLVVSDRAPKFKQLPPEQTRFVAWNPQIELASIQDMQVGMMPLADNEWTRGKCSFKMLQYMACEIPVIVSPVGMNAEVLTMGDVGFAAKSDDDWYAALEHLYRDVDERKRMGDNGRQVIVENFSAKRIASQLADIFQQFSSR